MRNTINILIFTALVLAFHSCKKDDSPSWSDDIPRIATIRSFNYNNPIQVDSFKYDKQGRVSYFSTTQIYNGNYTEHSSKYYTYANKKITIDNYLYDSKWGTQTLELNDAGLCTRTETKDHNNNILETETFDYNSDGYLTNLVLTNPALTVQTSFIIADGNTIQSTSVLNENTETKHGAELQSLHLLRTNIQGSIRRNITNDLTLITDYEFYADTINTIGNQNRGAAFLGKQDKFLVKSFAYNGITNSNYTYTLDTKKRISIQAFTSDRYYRFTYY
jgi:hypothetical protein